MCGPNSSQWFVKTNGVFLLNYSLYGISKRPRSKYSLQFWTSSKKQYVCYFYDCYSLEPTIGSTVLWCRFCNCVSIVLWNCLWLLVFVKSSLIEYLVNVKLQMMFSFKGQLGNIIILLILSKCKVAYIENWTSQTLHV